MSVSGHLETVVGFLRGLIRVAAHSSPTTSPTSRFLQQFRDAQAKKKWDFGLSTFPPFQLLTKQEVEECGGSIIEMPACETLFNNLDLGQSDDEGGEFEDGSIAHGEDSEEYAEEYAEQDWDS